MPKTVCATALTSRTVCFAGLLGSARTWTSIGRPDLSPTTRTAWTPLRRQSSSSRSLSSAAGFLSPSDDNSSFDHSPGMATPSTPRGPGAPARAQHTAIRPRSVGAARCRCYLWGLRGDQIQVKLCVPFVQRRMSNCLRVETAGPRPEIQRVTEAKRDVRRAHSVAQRENSCFRGSRAKGHGSRCGRRVSIGRNAARRWRYQVEIANTAHVLRPCLLYPYATNALSTPEKIRTVVVCAV